MKLTQTTGPSLEGQKPKGRKNWTLKPGKRRPQTKKDLKSKKEKRQRNTTQMKEQTINTEVQINDEKIGKLPEKEFRNIWVSSDEVDETRIYYTEWSESEKERQISYSNAYIWNLEKRCWRSYL